MVTFTKSSFDGYKSIHETLFRNTKFPTDRTTTYLSPNSLSRNIEIYYVQPCSFKTVNRQ